MEFEQIVKRLEWLDDEHRKDKAALKKLEERIATFDNKIKPLSEQIKDLTKKVSEIGPVNERIDQFDDVILKQRVEAKKAVDEVEKKQKLREKELLKLHYEGLEEVKKLLPELDQSKDIAELKKLIKQRADEYIKLNVSVTELKPKIDEAIRKSEDLATSNKVLEENRRQDVKRVADLQGEITSVRKRVEEYRQKAELKNDTVRNIESRFNELLLSEAERKKAQAAFIEQQSLAKIDTEKVYKDWMEKVETLNSKLLHLTLKPKPWTKPCVLQNALRKHTSI